MSEVAISACEVNHAIAEDPVEKADQIQLQQAVIRLDYIGIRGSRATL